MKLTNVDLMRFLPQFMREDRNAAAFAYAVQCKINEISLDIELVRFYSRIDSLTDAVLDELAWQFNIIEYRADYETSVKRELVKGCIELHYKRGTVESVEDVVRKIFGNATVEEWFDYGGNPYHFRIRTSNTSSTDEMIEEVTRIVKETQSIRSYLEEVIIEIIQQMHLYIGCKVFIMDDVSLRTAGI